jgi:Ca2+-binding EF-hand superfamily protein
MPGKAGHRLRPLVGQIRPICILPENAVEALKESDRQQSRAMETLHGEKKDRNVNSMVSKAVGRFQKSKSIDPIDLKPAEYGAPKPPVEMGVRLSSVVDALRPEGNASEVKKEASADDGNIEIVSQNQKMPLVRKEASEALRGFIYGPEHFKGLDKEQRDKMLYEPHGTKSQVIALERVWNQLDEDNSGRVNIQEFRAFAKTGHHLQKLSDKVMGPLLGKKSSFTIEDMMRIIWPCATLNDVKNMKRWIEEYHSWVKPTKCPETIKAEELEALIHNFKFFDQDGSGQVTFAELTESGLLDKDMADRYMQEWDDDGSGELNQMEFCEMFCMAGYKVHEEATSATDSDGNRVLFVEDGIGWHRKDEWEAFLKGVPLKKETIDVSL